MLTIPPALLDLLGLAAGNGVGLAVEAGRLVVEPDARPRYSLDELLAQCSVDEPLSEEDREWLQGGPAGREII